MYLVQTNKNEVITRFMINGFKNICLFFFSALACWLKLCCHDELVYFSLFPLNSQMDSLLDFLTSFTPTWVSFISFPPAYKKLRL